MSVLITGSAGFIGFHLCKRLVKERQSFIGIDNLNNYYDVSLKEARLSELKKIVGNGNDKYKFFKGDLTDLNFLEDIFSKFKPKVVVNLAAQAGVRYSLKNPHSYINSNLVGFHNLLDCAQKSSIENFIYASSSSVYGGSINYPYSETNCVNHPVSLYAATKKSNELIAHSYSHLFKIPTTGVRLFTVYGPWGRPDMAPFIFTKSIRDRKAIKVFNFGDMYRDFTYIDDVIDVLFKLIDLPAEIDKDFDKKNPKQNASWAPYKILNLGNNQSTSILDFISMLEKEIGIKAKLKFEPMQPGDVKKTAADSRELDKLIKNRLKTDLNIGIKKFIKWYNSYHYLKK